MENSNAENNSEKPETEIDGVIYVRLFRWNVPARYLFLAGTLLEFVEWETLAFGHLHHLLGAVIFTLYGALLRAVCISKQALSVYAVATIIAWALDVANLRVPVVDVENFAWLLSHMTLAVCLALTFRRVTQVTEADIGGAVALYLMAGMVFANIYHLILEWCPNGLTSNSTPRIGYGEILYFSMITQLTVGYGDIIPVAPIVRVVSALQSVFGVMYIAILISWMVSSYIASHNRSTPRD